MGRGAVGKAEPWKARYRLSLLHLTRCTWGVPLAEWWSDDADELRRQAKEGKDCVERQGMYYRMHDTESNPGDMPLGD